MFECWASVPENSPALNQYLVFDMNSRNPLNAIKIKVIIAEVRVTDRVKRKNEQEHTRQ